MTIPREDAEELLRDADLPVAAADDDTLPLPRVEICRRLLEVFHHENARLPRRFATWQMPIVELFSFRPSDEYGREEFLEGVMENVGLVHVWGSSKNLTTFGDLMLYVEGRLRHLWRAPEDADEQTARSLLLAELLRILPADPNHWLEDLSPSTPLEDCLPAQTVDTSEAFQNEVIHRFGVELPLTQRVFGTLEFDATWLAVWFVVAFAVGMLLLPLGPVIVAIHVLVSAPLAAWLLSCVSRPAWPANLRTLDDLCVWLLPENKEAVAWMRRALES